MEGMQYIQHRVADGTYQAVLNWRINAGIVEVKQPDGWLPTTVPVQFIKDFEYTAAKSPVLGEDKNG